MAVNYIAVNAIFNSLKLTTAMANVFSQILWLIDRVILIPLLEGMIWADTTKKQPLDAFAKYTFCRISSADSLRDISGGCLAQRAIGGTGSLQSAKQGQSVGGSGIRVGNSLDGGISAPASERRTRAVINLSVSKKGIKRGEIKG